MKKTCTKCQLTLSIEEFYFKKPGLRRAICKKCQNANHRSWYEANMEHVKARASAANKRIRAELRELVQSLKEKDPCKDCKRRFPYYVMEYDHISSNKRSEVSNLIGHSSRKTLLDEIAKCDLVCANCHRIRTFSRMGSAQTGIAPVLQADQVGFDSLASYQSEDDQ